MDAFLFDRSDSILCVVDVQRVFLDHLRLGDGDALTARICWLIRAARVLGVPVVAMAEGVALNGTLAEAVRDALPDGCVIHDKNIFDLTGHAEILETIQATRRRKVILCGMETDICIAQSAVGLRAAGFAVGAVSDACATPSNADEAAFARMQVAGVVPLTLRSLYFEWIRDLDTLAEVKPVLNADLPEGLVL